MRAAARRGAKPGGDETGLVGGKRSGGRARHDRPAQKKFGITLMVAPVSKPRGAADQLRHRPSERPTMPVKE
jgi:hypothetical protein